MKDLGWNLGYVNELYAQFLDDPSSVSAAWQEFFADYEPEGGVPPTSIGPSDSGPGAARDEARPAPGSPESSREEPSTGEGAPKAEDQELLTGASARLVENMEASLSVPTATSVRSVPMKLLEVNRRIINQHQSATFRPKVSFTHAIGWAVVQALQKHPAMFAGYRESGGKPHRVVRRALNLGLAIDVERRGRRMLWVPNLKDAGSMNFASFFDAYNDIVKRAREGKLAPNDFADTHVTLTNPGTLGTSMSVPRLMVRQGTIIGLGAIHYSPEFAGMSADAISRLGLSKVMIVTSTYDHRIIQGAESGAFLRTVEKLLLGEHRFYEQLFVDLAVPHEPILWSAGESTALPETAPLSAETVKQAQVLQLINAYRMRGHLLANIDPLGTNPEPQPELELSYYGLSVWDLDRVYLTGGLGGANDSQSLSSILETLRETYCRYVGVQYRHNPSLAERDWLEFRMESTRNQEPLDRDEQLRILTMLNTAESFERFLHASYVGHKRFSLEGCETLIPTLDALLSAGASAGVTEVIIGMAHRGRLNVLVNIVGKPLAKVFGEFEEVDPESIQGSGDVKYHQGADGMYRAPDESQVRVTLASNPSHLESVDPIVEGMARARQLKAGDLNHERILAVQIHGDAAFAGQGVVAETLNLSLLRGYRTGGTIHVVINNQIGFTTPPIDARSSQYATDVARTVGAPIFHVNADQPEAAVRMVRLALSYRQKFKRDVVVDLVCYRRWGHNEGDEPTYTQPLMYERIKHQRSVRKLYMESLLRRGDIDVETAERMLEDFHARLDQTFSEAKEARSRTQRPQPQPDLEEKEGAVRPHVETGVPRATLEKILPRLIHTPSGFEPHQKLLRQLDARNKRFQRDQVDWGLAEALAFGSLALEGVHVRLSGQDSGRGTFSQRHAILYDHRTGASTVPLANLAPDQGLFHVYDSFLSEFAVLGFEYGYSVEFLNALVLWEAQFGDFVNGAQVIIDQYLSSAEEKWGQRCNLVLLLPHGYEGQGPEHSSARLERFLQLTSEGNMQVAYPTTPAQYFHLLRRQVRRDEYKPLVVMTPKSLLRLPAARSSADAFSESCFQEVLSDPNPPPPDSTRRILLTSGKVYYDLESFRDRTGTASVVLIRIEQFYPFPREQLREIMATYSAVTEVFWVQEEPRNMGAWDFLDSRLLEVLGAKQTLRYVGRPWSASPATGSSLRHQAEQEALVLKAYEGIHEPSRVSP